MPPPAVGTRFTLVTPRRAVRLEVTDCEYLPESRAVDMYAARVG